MIENFTIETIGYKEIIGFITIAMALVTNGTYYLDTILTPHPFSWIIWAFITALAPIGLVINNGALALFLVYRRYIFNKNK